MSKKEKNNTKKIIFGIILLIIILVVMMMIYHIMENNQNKVEQKEPEIERITSRTLNVEGKEAKYTLLKNGDGTVYGIEFQNLDLMAKITIIDKKGEEKEIKDSIINNIYQFTTKDICKLKIETIDEKKLTTAPFKVIAKETTTE